MPYWRYYFHFVWAVKGRQPLITDTVEALLFPAIANKVRELGGQCIAVNGTEDHIHLVTTVPPRISTADFVGQVKGSSSYIVSNHLDTDFSWQAGYGGLSFGERDLKAVTHYVQNQKIHHANQKTRAIWETFTDDNDGPPPIGN